MVRLALLALTGLISAPAAAQDTPPDLEARTRLVASQLRCPVCQGLSIQDSPSELAQEMKQVVRAQLAAGRTPDEVKAYFVARYGEWILLEPEPRGFNLAVYLLPVLALLAGLAVVGVVVRRWTRSGDVAQA
ncbi:MAG: cytochrome c-type biogenesis protein CcmH [Gemmatimonadetes bacterium]|nr:cytochrome c-type biogenesis protein CcmH [Gemmatimonadota bacterium]